MDRAFWITWYNLPDEGRDAYLSWPHGTYLPKVLAKPGVLWGAHYASEENVVPLGGGKGRVSRHAGSESAPAGDRFILKFGSEKAHVFANPAPSQFHARLPERDKKMLAMRVGERAFNCAREGSARRRGIALRDTPYPDRGHGYNKQLSRTLIGQPTMDMHPKIAQFFEGKEQFYPVHLEAKYSRIFNRIMDLWGTLELEDFLGELMVDKRGGRQGFPPDVMNDILTLSRINGRLLELRNEKREENEDPWASALTRTSLAAEQIEFNMKGFGRAIELDNARAVKLFLKAGVRPDEKGPGGWTPLMMATTLNKTAVAAALIGAKADINLPDAQGYTPLHWAAFKGFPEMTKLLVEKGADVNAKSPLGLTPLMQAVVWGHDRVVGYLLSKGARVNEADNDGLTALHAAITDGHVAVVKVLIAAGADPDAKSAKGLTPAIIAKNKKNPAILAVLSK